MKQTFKISPVSKYYTFSYTKKNLFRIIRIFLNCLRKRA